jgi:transposase
MLIVHAGMKVHLALGYTDMRKGMDGLAMLVQETLKKDPFICGGADYVAAGPLGPLRSRKSAGSPPHNI